MLPCVLAPSVRRFLGVGAASPGIPGLPEIVLLSAALCLINTSDAIQLGSCSGHEWSFINFFPFFFFFLFLGEFPSNFGSFRIFTIYGQGSFSNLAKMKWGDYRKMNYGRETGRASVLIPVVRELPFAACDVSNHTVVSGLCRGVAWAQRVV